jgi:hypothetical protein
MPNSNRFGDDSNKSTNHPDVIRDQNEVLDGTRGDLHKPSTLPRESLKFSRDYRVHNIGWL